MGPDYWVIQNAPLKPVLAKLYELPETRIDLDEALEHRRYDFELVLPENVSRETMIRLMRAGVEKQVHVREENGPTDVYVISAPNGIKLRAAHGDDEWVAFGSVGFTEVSFAGSPPRVPDGLLLMPILDLRMVPSEKETMREASMQRMKGELFAGGFGLGGGGIGITAINQSLTMDELAQVLESGLDLPVVNETGLSGTYALNLQGDRPTTQAFLKVLADTLGIVSGRDRRAISRLVVRPRA